MVAGDVRANENLALTATHTLFAREHNRIVEDHVTAADITNIAETNVADITEVDIRQVAEIEKIDGAAVTEKAGDHVAAKNLAEVDDANVADAGIARPDWEDRSGSLERAPPGRGYRRQAPHR